MNRTEKLIAGHEGYREFVYDDATGKTHQFVNIKGNPTVGYGLNLFAGLPKDEAELLMKYRINKIRSELPYMIPAFNSLSANRQDVLISMAYNMGISGLMKFKKMLSAIEEGGFTRATMEMENSQWFDQVKSRAAGLADLMLFG